MARTPKDELLLAKMIAAAKARGLKGTTGAEFRDSRISRVSDVKKAISCCAVGAHRLARGITTATPGNYNGPMWAMVIGNDARPNDWTYWNSPSNYDNYESIGHAFAEAMEEPYVVNVTVG